VTFEEDFQIIKNLTEIQSCSGSEDKIRQYIKETIEMYCDKVEVDILGNLYCFMNGNAQRQDAKLNIMLDAHMDEIGFMVRFIDKNGFIRFSQVGGQNPRILPGQIVTIRSNSGEDILGVIGEKPIHLLEQDERKKASNLEDLFMDIGMSTAEEVKKYVSVGDYITLKQDCIALKENKRIFGKSFDDRAGCFILIKLIMELSQLKDDLNNDLTFLFASQEETGARGATVGAFKIMPDISITVEVTHAIDFPGISSDKYYECNLGSGVSIAVGPNLYPKISKLLIDIAKEEKIPYVLEAEPYPTSTNARVIQMTKEGIPCGLVSVPLRYMHTNVEIIEYQDLIHAKSLLKSLLLKDLKSAIKK